MRARRTQGFERGPLGPTDKTRSELRVTGACLSRTWLQAMPNYLEKEWTVRSPGEGARSKPVLTTGLHSLPLAQTLCSLVDEVLS